MSRSLPSPAAAVAAPVPLARAALRVVVDAAAYRIRKHEAGNLLATTSLLLARGAPLRELLVRVGFAALLNLLVYLLNDLCDVETDLAAGMRDRGQAEFLRRHRPAALLVLALLFGVLLAAGIALSGWLVVALVGSVAVVGAYSLWLKRLPVVDVVLAAVGGVTMTLPAVREADLVPSLLLCGFLGLVSACFEVIQVTRDEPTDRQAGLRTTAAMLGPRGVGWIFRALVVGAAAYAVLVIGGWAGLGLGLAVLLPLDAARAPRSWDLARVVFGGVWIALLLGV